MKPVTINAHQPLPAFGSVCYVLKGTQGGHVDVLRLRFVRQYRARRITEICQQIDNVCQYRARCLTEICQQIDNVRQYRARRLTEICQQIDNVCHDRARRLTEIC